MDDILIELIAIGEILSNAMVRLSPSKVAEFILSAGRTYGKLLSPEKSFDILVSIPVEVRDSIVAETGSFVKYKKALDDNDKNGFLSLCENDHDVSTLLYACGYLSEYNDAARNITAPEENPFDEEKVSKNAHAIGQNVSISSCADILRIFVAGMHSIGGYLTSNEQDEILQHLLNFRSNKECYTVILEDMIELDPDLRGFRAEIIKKFGEDEIERQFLLEYSHTEEWHLPKDIFEQPKRFDSFAVLSKNYNNYIKENLNQFENFVNEVARFNVIENTNIAKNTFSQIILGIDLGCKENLPLTADYPPFMCYVVLTMFGSEGYVDLPKYFDFGMTEEEAKKYFNSGTERGGKCKKMYKRIIDESFPRKELVKY